MKPGADPRAIRLKIGGGGKLSLDVSGAVKIATSGGSIGIALPKIYQEIHGTRKTVAGHYAIRGADEVAFEVEGYDRSRKLVIDPTIVYSTLLGGGTGSSAGNSVAVDSSGNTLVAGYTLALDFPTVNAAQSSLNLTQQDGFVSKLNAAGTALIYSTYLGGSGGDTFTGIAVDGSGAAWVTGQTVSGDFPLLNPVQATYGGGSDAVVVKLDASGALQFSSYLGGSLNDSGLGIATDTSGNAYVTGATDGNFPVTAGALQSGNGGGAFVTKFSTVGSQTYSAVLTNVSAGTAVAADSAGDAWITGYTYSSIAPGASTAGPQQTNQGNGDAFVAEFNPAGTALQYFTYFGGTGFDRGNAIALDTVGNVYFAGTTNSAGLATAGAAQTAPAGGNDGFVAKLNIADNSFSYVTYLGGLRQDYLTGLAVDGSGNAVVAGYTDSADFPVYAAVQPVAPGNATSLFTTGDMGATWTRFDSNIPGAVLDISVNPVSGAIVVLTELGIYRSTNGGGAWSLQLPLAVTTVGLLARSPVAAITLYASSGNTFFQSPDDGVTWNPMAPPPLSPIGIIGDPISSNTVYAFGHNYSGGPSVYRTTDGGATWNAAAAGLPNDVETMAGTVDGKLYAGSWGMGIYKSTDQGGSWDAGVLPGQNYAGARSLTAVGNTLYFADGVIYRTTNSGVNWISTYPFIETFQIAVSPTNPSVLYGYNLGYSNNGVSGVEQSSGDGGSSWNPAGTGLPENVAREIVADPIDTAKAYVIAPVNTAGFAAKLNTTGTSLAMVYVPWRLELTHMPTASPSTGSGNAYVTGSTSGPAFPAQPPVSPPPGRDWFGLDIHP